MVNRNLLRQFDVSDSEAQIEEDFEHDMRAWIEDTKAVFDLNDIIEGTVREIRGDDVVVDIGYKSEGIIRIDEWREEGGDTPLPKVGDKIQVLLETVEDEQGLISLSYRKAKRQKEWKRSLSSTRKGMWSPGRSRARSRVDCWSI